jgi:hypothetical protein
LRDNGLGAKCKTPLPFPSAGKLLIFCGHAGEQFGRGLLKTIPLSRSHQTWNPRRGLARAYKPCCTMLALGRLTNLFCPVEQLDRREWLYRGDSVLIDELRLPIPGEQNAEVVERGHVALELDAVCKKHYYRNLAVLKVPEEHLLDRLDPLYCHGKFPFLFLITAETLGAYCRSSSSLTKWPWLSNLRQPLCLSPESFTCSEKVVLQQETL